MTLCKHQEALQILGNSDYKEGTRVLKFIRNSIIGNPTKKDYYLRLNLAPSLAHGNDHQVRMLINAGVVGPLFNTLVSPLPKLQEAGARALRAILSHDVSIDTIQSTQVKNLLDLATPTLNSRIAEVTIGILAKLAQKHENRLIITQQGAVSILAPWIFGNYNTVPKIQEAALDALAGICLENEVCCKEMIEYTNLNRESLLSRLFGIIREKRPIMRLSAAACIANVYKVGILPTNYLPNITHVLLPTIIRLLGENNTFTPLQLQSSAIFAHLVVDNPDLQVCAVEGDAISRIASIIKALSERELATVKAISANMILIRLLANCLNAIAAITSHTESARKQVIDLKLLPIIVEGLKHPITMIRVSSCKCTRSLSRSVKNLRTSLMDAGVAQPLFQLLYDDDLDVQTTASATLCNIILDFSPMKQIVIENGGIKRLVQLLGSNNISLRVNAVWALKNMLFQTKHDIKVTVMNELGWSGLYQLLNDSNIQIQEQSLCLLRNLACGSVRDIEYVFNGLGEIVLMQTLESKLSSNNPDIIVQRHPNPQVRVAAIWCIINLTWVDDAGSERRVAILKSHGVDQTLEMCKDDENADVRDRAKTALLNLKGEKMDIVPLAPFQS